jgi:hypothetical protein
MMQLTRYLRILPSYRFKFFLSQIIRPVYVLGLFWSVPSLAQVQNLPSRPVWEPSPLNDLDRSFQWTAVQQYDSFPPQFRPIPANFTPQELAAKPRNAGPYTSRGIFGFGGGVRAGFYTGDPTNALFTTRFGYKLDENFSISLRPSLIFSDSDDDNNTNNNNNNNFFNNNELRLPLTFDLFHHSIISPYVGGGVATNTDGLGYTDGMLTGGVDVNITKYLTLGFNVNYIYQTNIDDTDWEALGMLYLRF